MKNKVVRCVFFLLFAAFVFCTKIVAQENLTETLTENKTQEQNDLRANALNAMSVETLFASYIANDLETQRLAAELEKQMLTSKATKINNGFDIQIETGTILFRTGKNAGITFESKASMKIPAAQNLSASVSSNVKINSGEINNTKLSLGVDIISSAREKRNVELLKAERAVLVAKRNLQNRALNAERDFYTELKNLYSIALSITEAQKTLYDDKINFEKIIAQGYEPLSSQYRMAELKVRSDENDIANLMRKLMSEIAIFAAKCGVGVSTTVDMTGNTNMTGNGATAPTANTTSESVSFSSTDFLPNFIPQVEPVNVRDFEKSKYTEIENATWTNYINSLSRKAEKDFSLGVSAGFTFKNENTNDANSVDASLNTTYQGVSALAGVNVPVGSAGEAAPSFTLGVSLNPNTFFLRSIEKKQNALSEAQEKILISEAEQNYQTAVLAKERALSDILWQAATSAEYFDLYEKLQADTARWYEAGIVSESEYLAARVNFERYKIQMLTSAIDLILYNDEAKLMFVIDNN